MKKTTEKISAGTAKNLMPRREMLARMAQGGLTGAALLGISGAAGAAPKQWPPILEMPGAAGLHDFSATLASAPRARNFKKVSMILTHPGQWDALALDILLHYRGGPRQVWDNTDIAGPWLNLMRNAMNAQIWSYRHPDFLAVSATHGACHLALFDPYVWEKYNLPAMIGHQYKSNVFLHIPPAVKGKPRGDYNDPHGLYSPSANCIPLLMERGAVFLACHNAIWEFSGGLLARGHNPDHLSHEALAAELTNHLIPGVVLTPGIVATIPQLELAGYQYIK